MRIKAPFYFLGNCVLQILLSQFVFMIINQKFKKNLFLW